MTIPDAVRPRRPRRATLTMLGGWVVLLLVVGFAVFALRAATDAQHRAQVSQAADALAISKLSVGLDQTRAQLQQHGVVPKAPPATSIIQGVPGAAGQSIVGPQGAQGPAGVSPDPAAVAQLVLSMVHVPPGPAGPSGPAGIPGIPGKDSTIPGPQGPAGAAGQDGKDGAAGQDGTTGAPGAAGQPPAGWTFTDGQGDTQDCERASGFDPSAPRYTCTITSTPGSPPPSPTPTPDPAPSQSAAAVSKPAQHRAVRTVSTGPGSP